MRHLLAATAIGFFLAGSVLAQQGGDQLGEITFEELQDKQSSSAYFGIGAGYVGGFWFYPAKDISTNLVMPYAMHGDYTAPIFTSGINAFLTLSLVGNLRVGFEALSGSQTHTESMGGSQHRAALSLSSAALQLDYAFPLLRGLIVAPGVYLGRGTLQFEHTSGPSSADWPNANGNLGRAVTSTLAAPDGRGGPTLAGDRAVRGSAADGEWGRCSVTPLGVWQESSITTCDRVPPGVTARVFVVGLGVFLGLFRSE